MLIILASLDLLITNDMLINFDEIIAKARNVNFKSQIFDISEKVERDSVIYVS